MNNWKENYRSLFPVADTCTYLDASYDCGGNALGVIAAERFFSDWGRVAAENERGGPGRKTFFDVADDTRHMLGQMLGGVSKDQIAFSRNTNEGINTILQGFDFKAGDNIVFHSLDHDSVVMPSISARDTHGIELNVVEAKNRTVSAEELITACDDHTRIVVTSHLQPATGYCMDLDKLGHFCREKGIFLVVDAIQSFGVSPFEAEKWCVDAVSVAGYKWLGAVNSIAFYYVSAALARHVRPVYAAAGAYMDYAHDENGWHLTCTDEGKARKFENSSLDNLGIYILHDNVQRLLNIGIDTIKASLDPLVVKLHEGLKEQGWNVVTPEDPKFRCSIVSLLPSDKKAVFDYFRSCNVAMSISAGTYIRLGIAPFNNMEDIDHVLSVAKDCPIR